MNSIIAPPARERRRLAITGASRPLELKESLPAPHRHTEEKTAFTNNARMYTDV